MVKRFSVHTDNYLDERLADWLDPVSRTLGMRVLVGNRAAQVISPQYGFLD